LIRPAWLAGLGLVLSFTLAAASGQEVSAPALTQRLGCWACHSLKGPGGKEDAPLAGIGARLSPADLQVALTHPRSRNLKARMPSYVYLRPGEMQALIDYLASLK
jgi:hypothetical protein